jgi:hypothetical protein
MRSISTFTAAFLLLLSFALFHTQVALAQQGDLTINGTIKLSKEHAKDLDECFFHYKNILQHSKMPASAVLNSSDGLKGPDLLNDLLKNTKEK